MNKYDIIDACVTLFVLIALLASIIFTSVMGTYVLCVACAITFVLLLKFNFKKEVKSVWLPLLKKLKARYQK